MFYPYSDRQLHFLEIARGLAPHFATRAAENDRTGAFPYENFQEIRSAGLPALVIPETFGGWGANLLETVQVMETLATGDGSTALSLTMHMQTMGHVAEVGGWPAALFAKICRHSVERGALINSVATEPELGSPSRGGKPKTTAHPLYENNNSQPTAWLINGHKTWASMCPVLDYMIIPALLQDGSEQVARFVVPSGSGERIVETWDGMGMRSTGSHDVIFEDVRVEQAYLLNRGEDAKSTGMGLVNAWFMLTVGGVYLGVAEAALTAAADFACKRVPTALGKPIAETEGIQRQLGQAQFLLQQARMQLYHAADLWGRFPEERSKIGPLVNVAKVAATNHAIQAVEHCMRVVGGASLTKSLPLERYYRDVRGGLYHPIHDETAFLSLGKLTIAAIKE